MTSHNPNDVREGYCGNCHAWKLTEEQMRAKVIELLDGRNQARMDLWTFSGTLAGVIDGEIYERVMSEEIPRRSHDVQVFWLGICTCAGHPN